LIKELDIDKEDAINVINDSLDSIQLTIDQTSNIIKNLKTFSSKVDFEQLESVKLNSVVESALKISKKRCFNAGINVFTEVDPSTEVYCNSVGLSQVILNLIINAIDAIDNSEQKWIRIESKHSKGKLKISITDSGLGIDEDIHNKIMQPFFSTKPPGKGTGLGLSISLKSIAKMNGQLYYNQNSKNTQFVIMFKQ
jgi:C4-dicarboxylate-specific signal transduction histidine kinase